jgi:hypothetical protein
VALRIGTIEALRVVAHKMAQVARHMMRHILVVDLVGGIDPIVCVSRTMSLKYANRTLFLFSEALSATMVSWRAL